MDTAPPPPPPPHHQHVSAPVAEDVHVNASAIEGSPHDEPEGDVSPLTPTADVHVAHEEHEGEGLFQDAEGLLPSGQGISSGSEVDSVSPPIRAPISVDAEGEEDAEDDVEEPEFEEEEEEEGDDVDGSFTSEESFDSALERMAASSTASVDGASPVGSYTAPALVCSPSDSVATVYQDALRRLNELNSGVPSLDTSLLESSSEHEFRNRVEKIAEAKELSAADGVVVDILSALLPLVREKAPSSVSSNLDGAMPLAKLSSEDDDEEMGGENECEIDGNEQGKGHVVENNLDHVDDHSDSAEHEADVTDPQHAGGFRVRVVDEDLPSPAVSEEHTPVGAKVEDVVPAENSLVAGDGDKVATGEGNQIPVPEGDTCESRGLGSKLEAISIHNKDEGSAASVEPEFSRDINHENVIEGENLQEKELELSADCNLVDNAQFSNFQVVESKDREEVEVGGGKTGREISEVLPQESQYEGEESQYEGEEGKLSTSDVERVEKGIAEPLSGSAEHRSTENSHHGDWNYGEVLPDRKTESNQTISLESESAVNGDKGGIKEHQHDEQQPLVDKSVSVPKSSNVQSVKESVDSSKQLEAEEKSNVLREPQSGTEPVETHPEPVAEVKKEQMLKGNSVLHEYLVEKTNLQQSQDSLGSGLVHPVQNGDKGAGGAWGEEGDDDDDDNDNDEEETLVESSSSLRSLLRSSELAAESSDSSSVAGNAGPSLPARPAGLGRSVPALEPAPRPAQHNRSNGSTASRHTVPVEDNQLNGDVGDGNEETREKLHMIRVKFLRLAQRLGQTAQNVVVAQVLYRLELAEQLRGGRSSSRTGNFSFERANVLAEEEEAAGQGELDFTCTIMLLGKTGVGKSATINSIFDEVKSGTDAFAPATKKVRDVTGTVHGINLRVIDTPGLLPSFADQRHNERIMSSVKRFIKKSPPDIVLYFDRLDMQSRDYGDLPLLRTITDTFGPAIWFNAIVVLTHASSAPPDGANGAPLSYEMFVAQRSHVVQQTIRQAAGDMRLMNPVSLVENHPACRTNRLGHRVLPNGQVWKPQLLLLCFASKILAEANSLLKLQDSTPGRPFGIRPRAPPLPFLLSSLLQSRAQLKLPEEQMGDEDESDDDLDEDSDSDDEVELDELPPFRRLTKDELGLLDKEQRKAYFEELDYREKLFKKKQWKEELRRRAEMRKRMAASTKEEPQLSDELSEEENARSAAVPVPMPDMVLPPSFDSDNPSYRYRYLETASQWLVRPVLETHGWDHDSGYDGLNMEKMFVISKAIPASISGQITKDKKEANLQMEGAISFKHGEGKSTLCGVDMQTIGKDLAYTLRSETRFSNFRRNKTTGGLAATFLGDTIATGMKLEDKLTVGKRLKLVLNAGAITGRGDVAYGGSFEATLREKDYPIGHNLITLGLSIMNWHGDLAIGGNLQSQIMIGKTLVVGRANLNNRGAGQISIRASSSEQLQMALIGIIPILRALIANRLLGSSQPGQ